MPVDDVPVLIVGGSLVGLSTAVFLGALGIPSLVARAAPRDGDPPARRARQPAHDRAYRTRGSAGRDRGGRGEGVRPERRHRLRREPRRQGARLVFPLHQRGRRDISPAPRIFITQIGLEPSLLRPRSARRAHRVRDRGGVARARRRRRHRAIVRARDGGDERSVRARYLDRGRRRAQPDRASSSGSRISATAASPTASRSTSAPTSAR